MRAVLGAHKRDARLSLRDVVRVVYAVLVCEPAPLHGASRAQRERLAVGRELDRKALAGAHERAEGAEHRGGAHRVFLVRDAVCDGAMGEGGELGEEGVVVGEELVHRAGRAVAPLVRDSVADDGAAVVGRGVDEVELDDRAEGVRPGERVAAFGIGGGGGR